MIKIKIKIKSISHAVFLLPFSIFTVSASDSIKQESQSYLYKKHSVQSINLAGTPFDKEASKYENIDPFLLYTVALAESATGSGDKGYITPWPYTVRAEGKGRYFKNKDAAQRHLEELLERGVKNIDIGAMQTNLIYHPHPDPTSLLDLENNISYAASILSTAINSSPDDIVTGIGRYHNWDPGISLNYGQRIMAIYKNITGKPFPN